MQFDVVLFMSTFFVDLPSCPFMCIVLHFFALFGVHRRALFSLMCRHDTRSVQIYTVIFRFAIVC
jgi:hypothetical protein